MEIQINDTLFWKVYNALRDAESTLFLCDGAISDDDLSEEVSETHLTVENVLDKLQPIIQTLKQN